MKKEVYYPDYLQLSQILGAQSRESEKNGHPAHDEMLFIITHQTLELWMKQLHFELDSVNAIFHQSTIQDADLSTAHHRLLRILEIQKLMLTHLSVLETMTPMDFLDFRDDLVPASGFQSLQFKLLEKKLGIFQNHPTSVQSHSKQALKPEDFSTLQNDFPTLFEGVQTWLERNPFFETQGYSFEKSYQQSIQDRFGKEIHFIQKHPHLSDEQKEKEILNVEQLQRQYLNLFEKLNAKAPHFSKKAFFSALFIHLYRDQALLMLPYQVLKTLLEVDQAHVAWKQRHLVMVKKMIGLKMGTGGSSGQGYLQKALETSQIFPDLIDLSSYFIAREHIPLLPEKIQKALSFEWK